MDYEKMKANLAKCHKPFICSCGGTFRVCQQALIVDPETKKFVDLMTYQCDKCEEQTEQTFDADHLNEISTEEDREKMLKPKGE